MTEGTFSATLMTPISRCMFEVLDETLQRGPRLASRLQWGHLAVGQNPVPLVSMKIGGKWMFIHPSPWSLGPLLFEDTVLLCGLMALSLRGSAFLSQPAISDPSRPSRANLARGGGGGVDFELVPPCCWLFTGTPQGRYALFFGGGFPKRATPMYA